MLKINPLRAVISKNSFELIETNENQINHCYFWNLSFTSIQTFFSESQQNQRTSNSNVYQRPNQGPWKN